jgi:tetratricopeptide (TPR) repeat protein
LQRAFSAPRSRVVVGRAVLLTATLQGSLRPAFIGTLGSLAALSVAAPSLAEEPESHAADAELRGGADNPETASQVSAAARASFERGVAAYDGAKFEEAIAAFMEADELAPSPQLSFNIARCYERRGDDRYALVAYREYLQRAPSAANRVEVEQRITEIQRRLKSLDQPGAPLTVVPPPGDLADDAPTAPAAGKPEHEVPASPSSLVPATPGEAAASGRAADAAALPEPSTGPRWWTWVAFGASAASFVGAGAFELSRRHWEAQARQSQIQIDYARDLEVMRQRQTGARILLGTGAAAAFIGGVLLYFDLARAERDPTQVALGCAGAECWLQAGGRF